MKWNEIQSVGTERTTREQKQCVYVQSVIRKWHVSTQNIITDAHRWTICYFLCFAKLSSNNINKNIVRQSIRWLNKQSSTMIVPSQRIIVEVRSVKHQMDWHLCRHSLDDILFLNANKFMRWAPIMNQSVRCYFVFFFFQDVQYSVIEIAPITDDLL